MKLKVKTALRERMGSMAMRDKQALSG